MRPDCTNLANKRNPADWIKIKKNYTTNHIYLSKFILNDEVLIYREESYKLKFENNDP